MESQRRPYICTLLLSGTLILTGCAGLTKGQADFDVGVKERGIASWYGDDFHGWITASGETYDMYRLTGAHRTLPLGTVVRVTNVVNGRHVVVRINDRGPYVNGRIVDLSYAAAERLEMVRDGISAVQLEVVGHQPLGVLMEERNTADREFEVSREGLSTATSGPRFTLSFSVWQTSHRSARTMPSDLLRERRARRVADILAVERRVDTVPALALA